LDTVTPSFNLKEIGLKTKNITYSEIEEDEGG
jgi:hypothetical protein